VTGAFLARIARETPGLNVRQWGSDVNDPAVRAQVRRDDGASSVQAPNGTPTLIASGPRGAQTVSEAIPSYRSLKQAINQVG
jgi:hypothetical protein